MKKVRQRNEKGLPQVKDVEVSTKHIKLRAVLLIVFICIAIAAFTVTIVSVLSQKKGWKVISATNPTAASNDIVFTYYLDKGGIKGGTTIKNLAAFYTNVCYEASVLYDENTTYDGYNNVASINSRINELVTVSDELYASLKVMQDSGTRFLYYAPLYEYYQSIMYSSESGMANPFLSNDQQTNELFAQIVKFASDSNAINLQLLQNNNVKLVVSDEYINFAKENDITVFINFFNLKNAFIVDYLADKLVAAGVKEGSLSSRDGYMRTFENATSPSAISLFNKVEKKIYIACTLGIQGNQSVVRFRNYPVTSTDYGNYYVFEDGTILNEFIDLSTGLNRTATDTMIFYGSSSCVDIAIKALDVYIADSVNSTKLQSLKQDEIYTVYCKDATIIYNDQNLQITNILQGENQYTTKLE